MFSPLLLASMLAAQELGHIEFPTSARSAEARDAFVRGVLLLHSFEYEDAREAFASAREREPDFAMAYWGEALTFQHPIWRREEPDLAREALRRLAPTPAERRALAPTDVEKAWLHSVEVLFGDGTRRERWTGYRDALAAMRARYPHDVEVAAMYTLSILGTSFGGRDFRIYMQAAGIGEQFYRRYPRHPGLLHYLIHSYDDPVHAPLGLRMARAYDKVAPAAGHALHMPSHIYLALGMWEDSVRANVASFEADDARWRRKQLSVDERGWHACQWLAYSLLQRGQVAAAERQLELVRADHATSPSRDLRYHLVVIRAAHLVHAGWDHPAAAWEVDLRDLRRSTASADHFVRGMAALAAGDLAGARARLAALRELAPAAPVPETAVGGSATCCAPSGIRPETEQDRLASLVALRQLEGALAARQGRVDEALARMREACALEDRMGFDFGPPDVVLPAHEQLGAYLLELGRAAAAAAEFEAALLRAPGRARSLLGLARAHRAEGRAEAASAVYRQLAGQWRDADAGLADLAEILEHGG